MKPGVQYVVIGGMAIIQAGYVRATGAIDILVESSLENLARVKQALMELPDQAVAGVREDEFQQYVVVRVADEFVVDVMVAAGGIDFKASKGFIQVVEIHGVKIPFASPELLWRMKQTLREKDKLDLLFLKELLGK